MQQEIQTYLEKLTALFKQPNLADFYQTIEPDIQAMQNFRFYFSNPIFAILILMIFLILTKLWGIKKSFSYCLILSSILYFTTRITAYTSLSINGSGVTYADIIKFIAIVFIALTSVYYFLMKS